MSEDVKCDCLREIVGQMREVSPGVYEQDKIELIQHSEYCPLREKELPPLGLFVIENVGADTKFGK